ncbi:RING finger protein 151-like isoform X2 [Amphiura filiformis]|uniref:RING finger protein 151-like isoform X2 n=1 Tax=Amphiura filiformis TaxID=82378 RepID=UPI003B218541
MLCVDLFGRPFINMGYDIERFEGTVNDGLLCSICRDVLEDPLQAPCEHVFCSTCIHGWLVHEQICPEDRQSLSVSELRPIFRYMRNDLNQLRIRCINAENGCDVVYALEHIAKHESECGFGRMTCPNGVCGAQLERRELDAHLAVCEHRTRVCSKGCGLTILNSEIDSHNCVAELRMELELVRSETICKLEEQKHEMKLRLDSQRTHMVQKVGGMHQHIEELRSQVSHMQHDIRVLNASERKRRQDMERMDLEKRELLEVLKSLKEEMETSKNNCRVCHGTSKKETRITAL